VQLLCRWDPIGSGQGLNNLRNIQIIIENANVPVIVDAELEHLAKQRMLELGADGVLLNTVAQSRIQQMASAMKLGVQAGRLAYLAGRMEKSIMPAQVHP
jgi:thiazole synthase